MRSDVSVEPIGITMRHPAIARFTALPILAGALVLRRAQIDEAADLADLLGRAFVAETWNTKGTEDELFRDETVRATWVVAEDGRLLATASLQVRPDLRKCGWVRWVATEPDRRRQGLARALVVAVLAMAAQQGCREARLHTETDRLAAIRMYLQLGFEPLIEKDSEREVWNAVIS